MKDSPKLITITVSLALLTLAATGCGRNPAPERVPETTAVSDKQADTRVDRCSRHGLPSVACFICEPTLRDPDRLWCAGHDRYEDRCFLCHPEIEDPDRLWCAEHSLYEDECFLCHPELRESATAAAHAVAGLYCGEHEVPESECGICHPELAASLEPGSGLKIRFESARSARRAGVETARPIVDGGVPEAAFLARVTWDQNHFARVTPLAGGVLRRVESDVGQTVSKGDRMATLSSQEVSRVKSDYLSARADEELKLIVLDREKRLVAKRISAQQDARPGARRARDREERDSQESPAAARTSGSPPRRSIQSRRPVRPHRSSRSSPRCPARSSIAHAVPGEAVETGDPLFKIARLSSMWFELSIPEHEVALVSVGQSVVVTFDAQQGLEADGRVTWVGSSVDEQTRMVTGRAVVPNPDRLLRHGMFGQAHLQMDMTADGLSVPAGAVQHIDEQAFVFARLDDDLYELRRVSLGATVVTACLSRRARSGGRDRRDAQLYVEIRVPQVPARRRLRRRLGQGIRTCLNASSTSS